MVDLKAFWSEAEVNKIIAHTLCLRDALIIQMLFRTALRASELASIRVADMDFANALALIEEAKKGHRRPARVCASCGHEMRREYSFCPKCGADNSKTPLTHYPKEPRYTVIAIDRDTMGMAREYLERRGYESPWLFASPEDRDRHITRQTVYNIVRGAAERGGITEVGDTRRSKQRKKRPTYPHPHTLRHSAAVYHLDKGLGIKEVQAKLRHANPSTTAHYLQLSVKHLREMTDRVFPEGK